MLHSVVHLAKAQGVKCSLLHLGAVDAALNLFDLDSCHFLRLFAVKHFVYRDTTVLCHLCRAAQFSQRRDSGLNQVVGVRRALGLGKDVGNTHALKHGTHSAAGFHTGTGRSRLEEYAAAAEFGKLLVGYGTLVHRHAYQILLSSLHALGDSGCHLVGLAQAPADHTVLVTHYDDGGKAERTATLGHFSNTVDGYQAVFQSKSFVDFTLLFFVAMCY